MDIDDLLNSIPIVSRDDFRKDWKKYILVKDKKTFVISEKGEAKFVITVSPLLGEDKPRILIPGVNSGVGVN